MSTPIRRVAAYTAAATRRGVTLIDSLPDAGDPPRRVELHVADLAAVLAALADACDDHEACVKCGAVSCQSCGIGEPLSDCEPPHCTGDPWCWDGECVDDAARERYYEQQADLTGGRF